MTAATDALSTNAMPIDAKCRRLAAMNCGPHPLFRVCFLRHRDDGAIERGYYPELMTMPRAQIVAYRLSKTGRVDVWFVAVGRVG
jgi:hypothetical protein